MDLCLLYRTQTGWHRAYRQEVQNTCAAHPHCRAVLHAQWAESCIVPSRANPTIENYDIAALRFQTAQGLPLLYYTAHPIRTEFWGPVGCLLYTSRCV